MWRRRRSPQHIQLSSRAHVNCLDLELGHRKGERARARTRARARARARARVGVGLLGLELGFRVRVRVRVRAKRLPAQSGPTLCALIT